MIEIKGRMKGFREEGGHRVAPYLRMRLWILKRLSIVNMRQLCSITRKLFIFVSGNEFSTF